MDPKRLFGACLLLVLASSPLRAVAPFLVKDVDPGEVKLGSFPFPFLSLDSGVSLFLADDEAGRELWRSDGTAEGTRRLFESCAGACSLRYSFIGQAGDRVFFATSAHDPSEILGNLWVTDGSPAGTVLLAEELRIDPEVPPVWIADPGLLFFVAGDGEHGFELWRSNGTAAGTRLLRDLAPGPESSRPAELTAFRDRLYFVASDPERGPALWTSNGRPRGTRLVRDPWEGRSDHPAPAFLQVAGDQLLFFAPSPAFGFDLWRSDGMPAEGRSPRDCTT